MPPPGPPIDQQGQAGEDEAGGQRDDDVRHAGGRDDHAGQRREGDGDDEDEDRDRQAGGEALILHPQADRQLASTIIGPTDRSIPPEMTITAWAIARKASDIVPAVIVRISKSPKSGSCEIRQNSRTSEEHPTPTVQP